MVLHRRVGCSLALAITVSVLVSGCGGSGHQAATSSPQSPPPAGAVSTPAPTTSAPSAQPAAIASPSGTATAALATSGWLAGFKVALSQATLDRSSQSLTLDILVTNTAQRDGGLNAVSAEILLDPGDETGLVGVRGVKPSTDIVAGSTAHGTLTFQVATGFSLDKAQLVLGKPANHQWLVPLQSGRAATGQEPITLQWQDPVK
jgi:hypothetical protein